MMRRYRRLAALVIAAGLMLSGCSSDSETANTTSTTPDPPASPAATCVDDTGEAKALDVESISLERDGQDLTVTWSIAEEPTRDTFLYVDVLTDDEENNYQLSVTFDGSKQVAQGVFDLYGTTGSTNEDLGATVDGGAVTTTFVLPDAVGEEFTWYGGSSLNGLDVDACPGKTLSFKRTDFPETS